MIKATTVVYRKKKKDRRYTSIDVETEIEQEEDQEEEQQPEEQP